MAGAAGHRNPEPVFSPRLTACGGRLCHVRDEVHSWWEMKPSRVAAVQLRPFVAVHALLLLTAVLTGCSRPARLDPSVVASNAAAHASLGDISAAAACLEPLLADNAPHWTALFVAACVAVERGDLDRARDLTARLRADLDLLLDRM